MTFVHAWMLSLLLPLIVWVAWIWRRDSRHLNLAIKGITIAAIILALSEPVLRFQDRTVSVAILADTSASMTPEDLAEAARTVRAIQKRRGSNFVSILPFARTIRPLGPDELKNSGSFQYSAGDAGRATNLEVAVRDAIAALPARSVRRIALISDGNENTGSVTRAAWQAQQLGIPVDSFPMSGRPRPGLRVDSVSGPAEVFSDERFPVDLSITAPRDLGATVELQAEGKHLGEESLALKEGENHVRVRAAVNTTGAIALMGKLQATGLGESRFEYALTVRRPRVLVMSADPPNSDAHLLAVLAADQFEIEHGGRDLPKTLADYQLIIYNNWNMEAVPSADQKRLEAFEQQGGGLLWISGEKNVYVDRKGEPEEPLSRALPAKLAPPRSPEGTCVILIMDKSSSMEGKKMDLARLAAIGVIDNLRPTDMVAVLIFDNSFQWAVPLRKAEDRSLIKRLISGITPDGGTQIAPALAEAYRKIQPVNAVYKHIVLLTDGISEEGDSITLSREASNNHVTISTIGLGQDVNRSYLEKVASYAKGKSYFLIEPSGLEQILLKDVQEHTGTTAVEKPLQAEVKEKVDLLDGVDLASAPTLDGYIRFEARPDADTVLAIDQHDPLLVRWQYGLGRSAVFASDAKNRWAAKWLVWQGYDRFWTNVVRDLLPQAPASEATAEYDPATEDLIVTYRLSHQVDDPAKAPELFAIGPGQFRQAAQVVRMGPGSYRARVRIGAAQGLFRVRPLAESRAFPEVGFYRSEAELTDFGVNDHLLRQLASSTGGRFAPAPSQVFDNQGRGVAATLKLWPGLLAIAILLNLAELFGRKWSGLRAWFPAATSS